MRLFAIYRPVLREIPRKTGLFLCFHGFFRLFSFPGLFWTLHVFQQLHWYYSTIPIHLQGFFPLFSAHTCCTDFIGIDKTGIV